VTEQPYAASEKARQFRATGKPRTSKRVMSSARRAWYAVLVFALRGLLGLLWSTCRVTTVRGAEHLDALAREGRPAIIAYWHEMQIFCAGLLLRRVQSGLPMTFLTSPSVSGEVPAAILRRWGAGILRGSANRSAGQTLKDMFDVLRGQKQSLVVTPDGPTGPRHEFKQGTLMLARMARVPIVAVAYAARPAIRWRSWDRFILPLPFARVAIVVGEPWSLPPGAGTEQLGALQKEIEARMADAVAGAEAACRD
jgi:hypothetical protein